MIWEVIMLSSKGEDWEFILHRESFKEPVIEVMDTFCCDCKYIIETDCLPGTEWRNNLCKAFKIPNTDTYHVSPYTGKEVRLLDYFNIEYNSQQKKLVEKWTPWDKYFSLWACRWYTGNCKKYEPKEDTPNPQKS